MTTVTVECPTCTPVTSLVSREGSGHSHHWGYCVRYRFTQTPEFLFDSECGSSSSCVIAPISNSSFKQCYGAASLNTCNFNVSYAQPDVHNGASTGTWQLAQPACIPGCGDAVGTGITCTGHLFVTDVTSDGIVSNKSYVPGTIPVNSVLDSCTTDNDTCYIHFMAEGGVLYSPVVTTENGTVFCDDLQQYIDDKRLFYGTLEVQCSYNRTFTLVSSSQCLTEVSITRGDPGPVILSVSFIGGYPGIQTEVKAGDTYDIEVHFDPNGIEPSHVILANYGACTGGNFSLSGTELDWGTVHKATITATIDSTSNTATALPVRVSSRNVFGTEGNTVDSDSTGNIDGINSVLCNDITPSFLHNGTTYPAGQTAFKGTEQGIQDTTVYDHTSVVYSSPTGEIDVSDSLVYEQSKQITCTNPGTYNDSGANFRITAYRYLNGTSSTFSVNIEVADIAPLITVSQPQTRLLSSEQGESYVITATSNQNLAEIPPLAIMVPVSGVWEGASWEGTAKLKTRALLVLDVGQKGTADWYFDVTPPTNGAGIEAAISGEETVGGFTERTLTIDAWTNREVLIGTTVSDVTKLVCENLSKGGSAPNGGTIFTYRIDTDNSENQFTTMGGDSLWYNCDQANAVSNTSGSAKILLREVV